MSEPQIDIRPDHWAIVRDILQRHVPQYAVWAFGSRAKWTAKEYSDLDLAIITDNPLPLATSAALAEDFSESDLPWKVDIVDWAETSETFRKIIERDRVVVQESRFQDIGWTSLTLGELVSLQRGHDLTEEERHPGTVPVMGSAGQNGYHNKPLVKGPGIVIGRSGASFGQVHFCKKDYWPHNTTLYVTSFHGNDPYFTYHLLRNLDFTRYNSGSAQPSLNRNYIYPIKIKIPPIKEQRAIAHILGTLDERIELNRRINETLEAMVCSLFKSWFVDFDGLSAEDMQESELGLIPRGWHVGNVYDIADVRYGAPFTSSKFNTNGEGMPLVRIRDLRNERPGIWTEEIHPKGYLIQPGDIVVGMDGEFRAYIWGGKPAWMNQRICAFHPIEPHCSAFVHNAITPHLAHVEATAVATTVIHLGKGDIDRFRVLVPPKEIAESFKKTCQPFYEKIVTHKQQSLQLTQLRDTLLPKLISGEVRIKDAERLAETA